MRSRVFVFTLVLCMALTPVASADIDGGGSPGGKLVRGAVNLFTGWVEIPKRIIETAEQNDVWTGITWGLARGIGHGFVRMVAGAYDVLTFPVPAPAGYESVIQPEYVFDSE